MWLYHWHFENFAIAAQNSFRDLILVLFTAADPPKHPFKSPIRRNSANFTRRSISPDQILLFARILLWCLHANTSLKVSLRAYVPLQEGRNWLIRMGIAIVYPNYYLRVSNIHACSIATRHRTCEAPWNSTQLLIFFRSHLLLFTACSSVLLQPLHGSYYCCPPKGCHNLPTRDTLNHGTINPSSSLLQMKYLIWILMIQRERERGSCFWHLGYYNSRGISSRTCHVFTCPSW